MQIQRSLSVCLFDPVTFLFNSLYCLPFFYHIYPKLLFLSFIALYDISSSYRWSLVCYQNVYSCLWSDLEARFHWPFIKFSDKPLWFLLCCLSYARGAPHKHLLICHYPLSKHSLTWPWCTLCVGAAETPCCGSNQESKAPHPTQKHMSKLH